MLGNKNREALRAQLRFSPSNGFEAYLSLDRHEARERALVGDPLSDTFGAAPDTFAPPDGTVMFNTVPHQSLVAQGMGLDLSWTLANGATVRSLTGVRSTDAAMVNDTDYSPIDLLHVDYAEEYSHVSQELRYGSGADSRFRYMVGVSYLDQEAATDRHARAGAAGYLLGMAEGADLTNTGQVDTSAWGLFASADYDMTDQLTLSAGLRWSHDKKSVDWAVDTSAGPAFTLATGRLEDSRADEDLSPTVSLSYRLSGASNLFLRYAEGYKSGGYNLDYVNAGVFPDGLAFDKESARSYEAGVKGMALEGALWLSATAFWVDYSDFQVNQFRTAHTGLLPTGALAAVMSPATGWRHRALKPDSKPIIAALSTVPCLRWFMSVSATRTVIM